MQAQDAEPEGLRSVPTYVWLLLAGLAFSMFSGNTAYLGLPVGLDRPLYLMAALLLLLLLLDHRTDRLRWRGVYGVMALTLLWTTWSWLSTGSLTESTQAFALADRIGLPFAMFVIGPLMFSTPTRRDLLLKFLTVMGLYLGWVGIFGFSEVGSLVLPHYITDPGLGIQADRARGPFLSSEPFGMTCGLCLLSAIALLARTTSRWWRTLAALSVVLTVTGVVLCLTRSVWGGTLTGVVVAGLMQRRTRRALPAALLTSALVIGTVLTALPALFERITSRFSAEGSVYDRLNITDAAERTIAAHPLTGVGWGRFLEMAPDLVRQATTFPLSNSNIEVHDVFISRATETGLPGAALWLLAVCLGPVAAVLMSRTTTAETQAWRLIAVAAFFIWLWPSITSPNPYPLPNFLFWLLAGVAGRAWLLAPPGAQPWVTDRGEVAC